MKEIVLNITKITLGFCLALSILAPSLVKFSHVFNHHEHEICQEDSSLHFHALDLDCEFFKFKLNNHFYEFKKSQDDIEIFVSKKETKSTYFFLKNYWQLSLNLRGPPTVV